MTEDWKAPKDGDEEHALAEQVTDVVIEAVRPVLTRALGKAVSGFLKLKRKVEGEKD